MESNKVFQALCIIRDKISPEHSFSVNEKLKKSSDDALEVLMLVPYKNIWVAALLGWLLGFFGVNRFYVGDKKMGIIKLIIGLGIIVGLIVSYVITISTIVYGAATGIEYVGFGSILFIVLLIITIAYGIFCFVDIFLGIKMAKKKNYEMIMETLAHYEIKESAVEISADDIFR